MKLSTRKLSSCALFCALTAVFSQISLPLPFTPIPVNLATLSVLMAGGLLGASGGGWSMAVYLLLGFAGLPVFSGFRGGAAALAGPTGGYLAGYLAAAVVTGLLLSPKENRLFPHFLAMGAGIAVCYTLGTAWFMTLTHSQLVPAFGMCVLPFLPGDGVKIAAASLLCVGIKKAAGNLIPF